jgi:hypothetical protein
MENLTNPVEIQANLTELDKNAFQLENTTARSPQITCSEQPNPGDRMNPESPEKQSTVPAQQTTHSRQQPNPGDQSHPDFFEILKPHVCHICGKCFVYPISLRRHLKKVHSQ